MTLGSHLAQLFPVSDGHSSLKTEAGLAAVKPVLEAARVLLPPRPAAPRDALACALGGTPGR